jgi:hypothetical protein
MNQGPSGDSLILKNSRVENHIQDPASLQPVLPYLILIIQELYEYVERIFLLEHD